METYDEHPTESRSFLNSVTHLVDQVVHFFITKLELFRIEVEEEWRRVASLLVMLIGVAVIGHMALITLTLFLVAVLWEYRAWVLGGITILYGGGAALLWFIVKDKLHNTSTKLFQTTLSELRKDHEWLRKGQ